MHQVEAAAKPAPGKLPLEPGETNAGDKVSDVWNQLDRPSGATDGPP